MDQKSDAQKSLYMRSKLITLHSRRIMNKTHFFGDFQFCHPQQNPFYMDFKILKYFSDCCAMPNIYFISPKLNLLLKYCMNTSEELLRSYKEEKETLQR